MKNKISSDKINAILIKKYGEAKFLSDDLRGVIKGNYDLNEIREEKISNYLKDN